MIITRAFLVVGDFAENYSFVVLDAAQSFHCVQLYYRLKPDECETSEMKHVVLLLFERTV